MYVIVYVYVYRHLSLSLCLYTIPKVSRKACAKHSYSMVWKGRIGKERTVMKPIRQNKIFSWDTMGKDAIGFNRIGYSKIGSDGMGRDPMASDRMGWKLR